MLKKTLLSVAVASSLTLTGCLDTGKDGDNGNVEYKIESQEFTGTTWPLFNVVTGEMPIPNDILFAGTTDGTMDAGEDPDNPVVTGIGAMDGNSVVGQIDIKFSGSLDPNQDLKATSYIAMGSAIVPNPNQNIFLLPLSYPGGDGLKQASLDIDGDGDDESVEIPTFAEALSYQTAAATGDIDTLRKLATPIVRAEIISLDGVSNNTIRLSPLQPLQPETKYLLVLTNSIKDAAGNSVRTSPQYSNLRDDAQPLGAGSLSPVRDAVKGWERLAAGYFGFMSTVYESAGLTTLPTLSADDIALTMTFTTAGTDSVLKSIASPGTFFEKSLTTSYKQDAIAKLVAGTYKLNGDNTGLTTATDIAINTTLNTLLTNALGGANPLYNAELAAAIGAGADYATIASGSATSAFIMQSAAAQAAISVHDSGSEAGGDKDSFTIAQEAAGTVLTLAQNGAPFPTPAARATNFYQMDLASTINENLKAPAMVSQGDITLPYYLSPPTDTDGSNIVKGFWQADTTIGAIIDFAKGNPSGTTPPSSNITYRYPFPAKQADVTVPLLAVSPLEQNYGTVSVDKPANGWPVIIYQHGITTERSVILPMANALAFSCVNTNNSQNPADWASSGLPCFATVAIDQPLHGVSAGGSLVPGLTSVSDSSNEVTGNIGTPSAALAERHFNYTSDPTFTPVAIDYSTEPSGRQSGSLFFNLSSFSTGRDNLRQGSVDLMNLNASIANMDIDGNPNNQPDLDASRVYFVGHSLGGVNGIPYLATNNDSDVAAMNGLIAALSQGTVPSPLNNISAASLLNTGGGITKMIENIPNDSFGGPRVVASLAVASDGILVQGASAYETFYTVLQGLFDSVDPVTFAGKLSDGNTGILLTEIIGDGTASKPQDDTVPNAADTIWGANNGPLQTTTSTGLTLNNLPAPLAGTEPMIAQFGAAKTAEAEANPKVVAVTRFIDGDHETPVTAGSSPTKISDSAEVFTEMVKETAYLFGTEGSAITIFDSTLVED